jgi:hypothetical protein
MTQLTEHFSLQELTRSKTASELGIDNTPPAEVLANLVETAAGLERIRTKLGVPVTINSGYRCPKLNDAVHGVHHSAHESGYAADFTASGFGTPLEIVRELAASSLEFDKLIQEGTWVHVSFAPTMRQQVLTAHFAEGKATTYTLGA